MTEHLGKGFNLGELSGWYGLLATNPPEKLGGTCS